MTDLPSSFTISVAMAAGHRTPAHPGQRRRGGGKAP
jgi:hypothetical protein